MRAWAGRSEDELAELGERLWVQGIAGSLYPEAWRLVEAHRAAGHTVVFASSATRFQVEPAARAMGVEHVLVTPVEIENGLATGRPAAPRCGGAARPRPCARSRRSTASTWRRATPTRTAPRTSRSSRPSGARGRSTPNPGWRSSRPRRGGRSSASAPAGAPGWQIARTVAGAAGMIGGFGAGVALGALNGSRRDGVDLGIALAGDLGTALAGVRLDVRGAEYLESARPAVFLFNHQSQLDVLILAKLLRGGFTGVAKKEAANVPVFGLMFRLADMAFVDRGNTAQAKALAPAVARLREGISLVMAPEGTRSATPALGPFKKGAFHVAMQAGVPIVPIVIRNAGELMWRGSSTIREGTVQVTVLPPMPTDGWTVEDCPSTSTRCASSYLETLAEWDGPRARVQVTTGPTGPVAAPLAWGTATEMNPLETAMWRGELADPRLRSNVTLLELLDVTPDWDRLLAAHEWASRMVPRMRQRVVEPALGVGAPAWVTVDRVDVTEHVSRAHLIGGSQRELLDLVQEFARRPFDRDRPLWRALLVEGLPDGGAAYVVVTHHSATDGLGAVQLMARLHSRAREHDPLRPEPAASVAGYREPGRDAGGPGRARGADGARRRAAPADQARDELGTGRAGGAVARGGRRARPDRIAAARGAQRRMALRRARRAPRRAEGRRQGGGRLGERRVPRRRARRVPPLPRGARRGGARDDPGRHPDQPAHRGRPAGRQPVHRRAAARPPRRARPGRADPGRAPVRAPGAGACLRRSGGRCWGRCSAWLPGPVLGAMSSRMTSANDVQASNVPGVAHPVYIAGARITRMYPFGPLPGCAAMLTLISHDGTCCIGVNTDPAAVADPGGVGRGPARRPGRGGRAPRQAGLIVSWRRRPPARPPARA